MIIERQCTVCHKTQQIRCTPDQYQDWQSGTLIQVAMPTTPAEEREMLISGVCPTCFEHMFRGDDE